jgi:hypothetical protein
VATCKSLKNDIRHLQRIVQVGYEIYIPDVFEEIRRLAFIDTEYDEPFSRVHCIINEREPRLLQAVGLALIVAREKRNETRSAFDHPEPLGHALHEAGVSKVTVLKEGRVTGVAQNLVDRGRNLGIFASARDEEIARHLRVL